MASLFLYPLIYEIVSSIIGLLLFMQTIQTYLRRKTELAKYLIILNGFFLLSIIFSMIPKIFFYIHNTEDLEIIASSYELTQIEYFLLSRTIRYRFMTMFTLLAGFVAFYFTNNVISEKISLKKRNILSIIIVFGITTSLFLYSPDLNDIVELFGFLCIAIVVYLVYFRFFQITYSISKRPDIETEFRKKFQALALMSIFVILAVLSMFLSVIEYILFGLSYGVFYYLTMIFLLLMLIYSINGFISPQDKKEKIN